MRLAPTDAWMEPVFSPAMKMATLTGLLAAVLMWTARAELPPSAYAEMQANAGEELLLHIDKVTTEDKEAGPGEVVSVEATVKEVKRSETGLKAGDNIQFQYTSRPLPDGMVGPSPIPVLKQDETVPAWLTKKKRGYIPAARAYSFQALPQPNP